MSNNVTKTIRTISSDTIAKSVTSRNDIFLRRDLYRFMNYVVGYDLKRSHRANTIPKGPAKKLAKMLSHKDELAYVEHHGSGYWSDFISQLARCMNLVSFDTKGKYMGYSSIEPSYPDNYIIPCKESWEHYLQCSSLDKEKAIRKGLDTYIKNEFHHVPLFFPHERFESFGSGVNAASKMNLAKIRSALLDILLELKPGLWYSLSDLIAYIKKNHFNLIINRTTRDRTTKDNIYHCFYEYPNKGKEGPYEERYRRQEIQEGEIDAFERVEGRYVAFFLEQIPFILGFVNLAHSPDPPSPMRPPPYGNLLAFSLTQKFFTVHGKDPSYNQVTVTIQANHEVVVQYSGYAEMELEIFTRYGTLINDDQSLIFRLEKKKIADRVAQGEDVSSIIRQFRTISSSPLPQNIVQEIESWGSHGEKITLYRGYSLLEIEKNKLKEVSCEGTQLAGYINKTIDSNIFMVKEAEDIFLSLEDQGYFPQKFNYSEKIFHHTRKTHSQLKAAIIKEVKKKKTCEIALSEFAGVQCTHKGVLPYVQKELQKKNIPTFSFPKKHVLLVPLAYKKPLESIVEKAAEKCEVDLNLLSSFIECS